MEQRFGQSRTIDLRDFVSQPEVAVESSLSDVVIDMDKPIVVALPYDVPGVLRYAPEPPRAV